MHFFKTALTAFILFMGMPFLSLSAFEKVVIWGHKIHSSTQSYVHEAFFRGFVLLGYDTYWFDNSDDVSDFDFSECLFLTEGQADGKIPLRDDGIYLLHNTDPAKYKAHNINPIAFQVYTDDVLSRQCLKVDTCIYYDVPGRCVYMPWATDLFPDVIEELKQKAISIEKTKNVYWIGTIGEGQFGNKSELNPFIKACDENGFAFIGRNPDATGVSRDEHIKLISGAYMAPAIVGEWQKDKGYIPCRIFKNISYGQMGITNSKRVYELFEGKIVYNPDTYQLFFDAQNRLETLSLEELYELMDIVKTKHTYINRIHTLLDFLDLIKE